MNAVNLAESEELISVYTCAVCETICNANEVLGHPCVADYPNVWVDNNQYFHPQTEDGIIIRKSNVPTVGEVLVGENEPADPASNEEEDQENRDPDEILIEEVKKRPALYDYSIPLKDRSRWITKRLWSEIGEVLPHLEPDGPQKRWKSLRDTYMKILAGERKPSGAAGSSNRGKWRFYAQMSFIRDSLIGRKTTSNESQRALNFEDQNEEENFPSRQKQQKLQGTTVELNDPLMRIADALATPIPQLQLPPPPVLSAVDGFVTFVKGVLEQLDERTRSRVMFKIHELLHIAISEIDFN